MGIEDYTVRCDEATGQIEITIPENDQTEYILSDITQKGNFEIRNTANDEVLMNNDDIRSVNVEISTSSYSVGSSSIYMNINFNNVGSKKFKNITRDYQNVVSNDTSDNSVAENETTTNETVENEVENNSTNETDTNETTNETSNEVSEETVEEEDNTTEVGLYIDGTTMMTTSFSEVIDNGVMSLSLGSSSSNEETKALKYQAESLAAI